MDLDSIQLSTLFWGQPAGLINLVSPARLRCSEWVKVVLIWNSKLKKHSGLIGCASCSRAALNIVMEIELPGL